MIDGEQLYHFLHKLEKQYILMDSIVYKIKNSKIRSRIGWNYSLVIFTVSISYFHCIQFFRWRSFCLVLYHFVFLNNSKQFNISGVSFDKNYQHTTTTDFSRVLIFVFCLSPQKLKVSWFTFALIYFGALQKYTR